MKQPFATYQSYDIHHDPGEGYVVQHPRFGDVWFKTLHEAKCWIDGGCLQFGKLKDIRLP